MRAVVLLLLLLGSVQAQASIEGILNKAGVRYQKLSQGAYRLEFIATDKTRSRVEVYFVPTQNNISSMQALVPKTAPSEQTLEVFADVVEFFVTTCFAGIDKAGFRDWLDSEYGQVAGGGFRTFKKSFGAVGIQASVTWDGKRVSSSMKVSRSGSPPSADWPQYCTLR